MARLRQRQAPSIYRALLRAHEREGQAAAREAANPYVRTSLRNAFDAGWFYAGTPGGGDGVASSGLMSRLGEAAFRAGVDARRLYDKHSTGGNSD